MSSDDQIELQIKERVPFAEGTAFGEVGPYERLKGRVRFAVNPDAPELSGIVDLDKAPCNAQGQVEFSTDFCLLLPENLERGNRRLCFDYGNRANKRMLQFFNDAPASNEPLTAADAGNGFLFRRGYTIAWAAWQGDVLPGDGRMLLDLPVARNGDQPLTGLVRTEFIANQSGVNTLPLSGKVSTRSHPTVSLDPRTASLTRRQYADNPRQPIPPDAWAFARQEGGFGYDAQGQETSLIPSDVHLHLFNGFEQGWIYELVYTGRDPLVLGLGHVVVRNFVSFLRHADADSSGTPNPLARAGSLEKTYAWGRSQTGRCIRDFLHQGFNADAQRRRVFDGVLPHVSGGGLMWMNHRFANVVVPAGQQHEDHENIADRFPFAYAESTDHLTGCTDAILTRPDTDPKVLHTQTSTEYWQRRGSLVHTTTQGEDLEPPENVRVYCWSSSQHFAEPNLQQPTRGICLYDSNVVQTSMLFRAMLDALDRWASTGTLPPRSRYPLRDEGTLVSYEEWRERFPKIPGVMVPSAPNQLPLLNFGPDTGKGILSKEPPAIMDAAGYSIGIPVPDADGNDLGGVAAPMVQAPLATYTGWNLRGPHAGHGATFEFTGSTIPFPETPEEREATRDPRTSILERYGSKEGYIAAIRTAAEKLVSEGLMLEEDVERAVALAADWCRPRHGVRLL